MDGHVYTFRMIRIINNSITFFIALLWYHDGVRVYGSGIWVQNLDFWWGCIMCPTANDGDDISTQSPERVPQFVSFISRPGCPAGVTK